MNELSLMSELRMLFEILTRDIIWNDGRPARLGNEAGDVYAVLESGATHGGMVWVRYDDAGAGEMAEAAVYNNGMPAVLGLPVLVVNRKGQPVVIIDYFSNRYRDFINDGGWAILQQHAPTHRRKGTDPHTVEGLAMEPLLVRPSSPPALTVNVMPGWYDWNGNQDVWEGGDTGSLAAYVPVAASTVHFIIVCIDSGSNTIVIVDGGDVVADDIYDTADVGYADIEAVTIPDDYIPLAVVELATGQTTIGVYSITYDLRRWMAKGGAGGFALDVDNIMTDALGDVMVDANGNVMVGV